MSKFLNRLFLINWIYAHSRKIIAVKMNRVVKCILNNVFKCKQHLIFFFIAIFLINISNAQDQIALAKKTIDGRFLTLSVQYGVCADTNNLYSESSFQITTSSDWPDNGVLGWKIRYFNCKNEILEQKFYFDVSKTPNRIGTTELNNENLVFTGYKIPGDYNVVLEIISDNSILNGGEAKADNPKMISYSELPNPGEIQFPRMVFQDDIINIQFKSGNLSAGQKYEWFTSNSSSDCKGDVLYSTTDRKLTLNASLIGKSNICVRISGSPQLACICKMVNITKELPYRFAYENSFFAIGNDINSYLKRCVMDSDNGQIKGEIEFSTKKVNYSKRFEITQGIGSKSMIDLKNYLDERIDSYNAGVVLDKGGKKLINSRDSFLIDFQWNTRVYTYKFPSSLNSQNVVVDRIINNNGFPNPMGDFLVTQKEIRMGSEGINKNFYTVKAIKPTYAFNPTIKSIILPGLGSRIVRSNRYTKNVTKIFLIGSCVTVASKWYSNKMYNNYLSSNNQSDMINAYKKANMSNKIFLCSAITCGMIYSFDIGYTSLNMLKRRNNFVNFQHQDPLEL